MIFFTFELNKKNCSKKYLICSKLRWSEIWVFLGNFGNLEEERCIPHSPGMKKAYSSFPHSPRNRNSDSSFSPFLEEDNFMRNWELYQYWALQQCRMQLTKITQPIQFLCCLPLSSLIFPQYSR